MLEQRSFSSLLETAQQQQHRRELGLIYFLVQTHKRPLFTKKLAHDVGL